MIESTVTGGIAATTIMTLYIYLLSWMSGKRWQVIHVLATMLAKNPPVNKAFTRSRSAFLLATLLHYSIGLFFAGAYRLLIVHCSLDNVQSAFTFFFGCAIGTIAFAAWRFLFAMRSNLVRVPLPSYLLAIWTSHIVFAYILSAVLHLFNYA